MEERHFQILNLMSADADGGINMYLHMDRETFRDIIGQAADSSGRSPAVVEKIIRLCVEVTNKYKSEKELLQAEIDFFSAMCYNPLNN